MNSTIGERKELDGDKILISNSSSAHTQACLKHTGQFSKRSYGCSILKIDFSSKIFSQTEF